MKEFMVGAGGWAYFQIPGTHPLRAYAKIYDFVEVNSSFYVIPDMKRVKRWRGMVPHTFKFTVRCHRSISHKFKFAVLEQPLQIFERMIEICNTLKAEILHVLFPKTLQPTSQLANSLRNFIESAKTNGVRLAVEFRGNNVQFDKAFIKLMEDYNMIHSVDLSKDERPVVESNIHEPYDSELLWDAVRVLTRILTRAKEHIIGLQFSFMNHRRSSKKRRLEIMNAKNAKGRKKAYKILINMTEKTVGYAESAQRALKNYQADTFDQAVQEVLVYEVAL